VSNAQQATTSSNWGRTVDFAEQLNLGNLVPLATHAGIANNAFSSGQAQDKPKKQASREYR
jgi:hypothetical protein